MQHTFLSHCDVRGIGEVYKFSHNLGADITQGDLWGVALFEAAGEHCSEVGATGGQNHLVYLDKKKILKMKNTTIYFYIIQLKAANTTTKTMILYIMKTYIVYSVT